MSNEMIPAPRRLLALQPMGETVVYRTVAPERTEAGLVLDTVAAKKQCVVVAVGPGRQLDDGTYLEPLVQPGDVIVHWPGTSRDGLDLNGEFLYFCREKDIAGVVVQAETNLVVVP